MVGHSEEWKAYLGSKTALSLVAFYADCQARGPQGEVGLPDHPHIQLAPAWEHPPSRRGTTESVTELADLLREHFSTPVPRYFGGPATDPPNRLVTSWTTSTRPAG